MRIWITHLRPQSVPVMTREGFSLGALLLGPVWLLARGALIAAALALLAVVLTGVLAGGPSRIVLEAGLFVLLGVSGRDLVRWDLGVRGYRAVHVLAARDTDAALARLLVIRPEFAGSFMPPGHA